MFEFSRWLGATVISAAIRTTPGLPQVLQVIHLVTMGVVIASVLMIVLRIHGLAWAEQSVAQAWRRFAPWLWGSLAIMAATGATMALAEPLREASALSFWLKMALLLAAATGTHRLGKSIGRLSAGEASVAMRHRAKWILAAWMAVLLLGRAIGYDIALWGSLSPKAHL